MCLVFGGRNTTYCGVVSLLHKILSHNKVRATPQLPNLKQRITPRLLEMRGGLYRQDRTYRYICLHLSIFRERQRESPQWMDKSDLRLLGLYYQSLLQLPGRGSGANWSGWCQDLRSFKTIRRKKNPINSHTGTCSSIAFYIHCLLAPPQPQSHPTPFRLAGAVVVHPTFSPTTTTSIAII